MNFQMSTRNQLPIGNSFFTEYNDSSTNLYFERRNVMKEGRTFRIAYTTEEGLEKVEYRRFKNLNLAYLYVGRYLVKVPVKGGIKITEM